MVIIYWSDVMESHAFTKIWIEARVLTLEDFENVLGAPTSILQISETSNWYVSLMDLYSWWGSINADVEIFKIRELRTLCASPTVEIFIDFFFKI